MGHDRVATEKRIRRDEQVREGSLQLKLESLPYPSITQVIYGIRNPDSQVGRGGIKGALGVFPQLSSPPLFSGVLFLS